MKSPKFSLSSKRVFLIMSGLCGLLCLLVIGSVVIGDNMLVKKNNALTRLKLENRVLEEQKISLARAKKDIQQYAGLEKIAKQIVPQDKDQARTVRGLVRFAQETGINLSSIGFPSSSLGQNGAPAPTTGGGSSSSTPTAPAANQPTITQVAPVEGINGVFELEITLQTGTSVKYAQLLAFLEKLEANRRTSQVNSITITPDAANRDALDFDLTIKVYIKP